MLIFKPQASGIYSLSPNKKIVRHSVSGELLESMYLKFTDAVVLVNHRRAVYKHFQYQPCFLNKSFVEVQCSYSPIDVDKWSSSQDEVKMDSLEPQGIDMVRTLALSCFSLFLWHNQGCMSMSDPICNLSSCGITKVLPPGSLLPHLGCMLCCAT